MFAAALPYPARSKSPVRLFQRTGYYSPHRTQSQRGGEYLILQST